MKLDILNRRSLGLLMAGGMLASSSMAAETWTDTRGKTITAGFLNLEGGKVSLDMKGKKVSVPIDKLSPDSQKRAETLAKSPVRELAGPLEPGKEYLYEIPFAQEEKQVVERRTRPSAGLPMQPVLRLSVTVPPDFDPEKPQKVIFVRATISGNAGSGGHRIAIPAFMEAAQQLGWIIVSADNPAGIPRENVLDAATLRTACNMLEQAWPAFRTWTFATGGFSGGGTSSVHAVGGLHQAGITVKGALVGGSRFYVYEDLANAYECPAEKSTQVKYFFSNGKRDNLATPALVQDVIAKMQAKGCKNTRTEWHEGGHSFYRPHIADALKWFAE